MTTTQTPVTEKERALLLAKRQAIIIQLGAIEEYLGMERSIVPRRKRDMPKPDELRDKFMQLTERQTV